MIAPRPTNDGTEWMDVTGDEAGWAHVERPGTPALAEARGAFEEIEIVGSLFDDDQAATTIGRIQGGGLVALLYVPTRMKPIVRGTNAKATIRIYVPRGQ